MDPIPELTPEEGRRLFSWICLLLILLALTI